MNLVQLSRIPRWFHLLTRFKRRCDEARPSCQECVKKGFECPGYQKKPLQWRYVFQESEEEASPEQEPLSFVQPQPEIHIQHDDQFEHVQELQELWDEANSTLFNHLPGFDTFVNIWSKDQTASNGPPIVKDGRRSDSLAILHRRLANTAIPSFLIHTPAILVQYYFDYVCKSWSSFDSPLNPFRIIVSRLWSRNAAIYYAIQSMAAASLANDFPGMRAIGIQTQQQAIACLRNNPRVGSLHRDNQDDEFFLALLMIGCTTSWHDAADLGLEYLKEAKDYLERQKSMCPSPESTLSKQYPLFQQCLLYWNMLAAFVAEDSLLLNGESVLERPDSETSVYLVDGQALPHPWTGPLSKALRIFYQTARVVRAARIASRTRGNDIDLSLFDFDSLVEELDLQKDARRLEDEILFTGLSSFCGPVDTGDTDTPPAHFITLAEAYRCAALLQIYHVFPDILDERLRLNERPGVEVPALFLLLFPTGEDNQVRSVEEARRILALHIVSLLDQLPATSGTRCMHPILLTCISSDLVFSNQSLLGPAANAISCLNTLDVEVAQARRKISLWLSELSLILPKLRLQRVAKIVHGTWDLADCGMTQYWLDTMIDRNLETIMG